MKKVSLLTVLSITGGLFFTSPVYAGKGMLRISTEPGDAKIYINGQRKGSSPSQKGQTFAVKLDEGEYTIEAEKESQTGRWLGRKSDVFVGADTMQTINLDLQFSVTDAQGNRIEIPVVTSPEKLREITDRYRSDPNRRNDFIPLGNGTVLDKRTGLQWMQCSLGQTWTGSSCAGEPNKYKWHQVNNQHIDFAGKSDWRLPTISELETLVYCSSGRDQGRGSTNYPLQIMGCDGDYQRPALVQRAFPNTGGGSDEYTAYWSSSPYSGNDRFLWVIFFDYGVSNFSGKGYDYYVRLVRGGQ